MKKLLFVIALLLTQIVAQDKLIFGLLPIKTEAEMVADYEPTKQLLEKELGMSVELRVTKDYKEMLTRMESGTVDIALINGKQYSVYASDSAKYKYLATTKALINGESTDYYNSLFIVHRDSPYKRLEDIKGKNFAFSDPNSGSGYLIPTVTLKKMGLEADKFFGRVFFLKKHDKVYGAVAAKSIDAGAVASELFANMTKEHGDVFRVIKKSEPLPLDAIIASKSLDEKLSKKIAETLQKAESSEIIKSSKSAIRGYAIRDDSFYQIYRDANKYAAQ